MILGKIMFLHKIIPVSVFAVSTLLFLYLRTFQSTLEFIFDFLFSLSFSLFLLISTSSFAHRSKKYLFKSFCRICQSDVFDVDHHCLWMGTCVTIHDQRKFIIMLSSMCIYCFFKTVQLFNMAYKPIMQNIILIFLCFILPSLSILLIRSIYLMYIGQSYYNYKKKIVYKSEKIIQVKYSIVNQF